MSGSGTFFSLLAMLLFILFLSSANGDGECKKSPIKTLNDKMEVSWKLDHGKMVFTVTVKKMLDKERAIEGWVALGFMQGQSKFPPTKIGAAADFVVTFLKNKKKVKIQDCNTITHNTSRTLSCDTQQDYQNIVKLVHITRKDNKVVFGISRKPNTKDKEDVPFLTGPMWLITSFGRDDIRSCSDLSVSSIFDNKEVTHVCILPPEYDNKSKTDINSTSVNGTESNAGSSWAHNAVKMAKHHWIGVVIGIAGAVTLVAVVAVYCMCRRSDSDGYKRNKVMSFYREKDEDDEARVSMLSAQMT